MTGVTMVLRTEDREYVRFSPNEIYAARDIMNDKDSGTRMDAPKAANRRRVLVNASTPPATTKMSSIINPRKYGASSQMNWRG